METHRRKAAGRRGPSSCAPEEAGASGGDRVASVSTARPRRGSSRLHTPMRHSPSPRICWQAVRSTQIPEVAKLAHSRTRSCGPPERLTSLSYGVLRRTPAAIRADPAQLRRVPAREVDLPRLVSSDDRVTLPVPGVMFFVPGGNRGVPAVMFSVPRLDSTDHRVTLPVPAVMFFVPGRNRAVPAVMFSVPRLDSTVPRPFRLVPQLNRAVPRLVFSVPRPNSFDHLSTSTVPQSLSFVPQPNSSVPRPNLTAPRPSFSVPRPYRTVPLASSRECVLIRGHLAVISI
jgi:hypothetical protein